MDMNQIMAMVAPLRNANQQFATQQPSAGVPPQIAQMLQQQRQQQIIQDQLPQNRPQLSPEQLGAPQGLDAMRNTPADPTGFAARNSIGGQPPVDYQTQPINQEEQARLANLVASLQSQERPGFDSPTVLSGGGNAAMAGQASRLASMPGAQSVDIPGLAGSDNATPGAGVRELWSRPGFQAAEQARETEQARRQGMVSDRARIKADMRDGISPQYRLLDQMVGNRQGGAQQGGPDEFTRNAMIYGPQVAQAMADGAAKNKLQGRQLDIEQQKADASTKEVEVASGMIKQKQDAAQNEADSQLAQSLIADPTSATPGALNNIVNRMVRDQVIKGIIAKHGGGQLAGAIPGLNAVGASPADVQRVASLGVPEEAAPDAPVNLGAMATGDFSAIPNMIGNFFNNKRRGNADREHAARSSYFGAQ